MAARRRTAPMDSSGPYSGPLHSSAHQARNLYSSPQLPPPSQLHLPIASSFARNNTLPPIPNLAPTPIARYPPASYHPSLAPASLPPLPPPSAPSNQLPWPNHRTSASRDDLYPPRQLDPPKPKYPDPDPPQQSQHDHKDTEDGMPPTSDFVKKLYKCVAPSSCRFPPSALS